MWKRVLAITLVISLGVLGYVAHQANKEPRSAGADTSVTISPFSRMAKEKEQPQRLEELYPLGNPINILLLGIDRRSKLEYGFRSDVMILVSINPLKNNVVLASIPRDLWYEGSKINGLFVNSGWEAMKRAVTEITGLEPQRYILTDFEDFSWIVDAMGGVPVTVDRTFTDPNYPVDETLDIQTVTFTQGEEQLSGQDALVFARSRKGDNGEGSDWARMRRQHKILIGMLRAIMQPSSLFNPMVVENAFKTVTQGRMSTNLELADTKYLWDFYKDKDKYTFSSLYLDYEYLYSPPAEDYGGAWTVVPLDGNYQTFKTDILNKLQSDAPVDR